MSVNYPYSTTTERLTIKAMNETRRSSLLESLNSPLLQSEIQGLQNHTSNSNDPFQLNSSIWKASNSPSRRASDVPTPQNYTIWNQNGVKNSLPYLYTGNNGFVNGGTPVNNTFDDWNSPRRYSIDSVPAEAHPQPVQPSQQLPQGPSFRNHQSMPMLFENPTPLSPPLTDDISHPNESSTQLQKHYQTLDFYFTQDPYNRVPITQDSLSTSSMETIMSSQQIDAKNITLPKFPNNSSNLTSQQLFLVAFKSGRIDCFYLPNSSSLNLKVNDLVVVEADRGKDLGKIVKMNVTIDEFRLLKYFQFVEQQAALNSFDQSGAPPSQQSNNVPILHFPKPILRLAMMQEVSQLLTKLQDEEKAKKICQFKIESTLVPKNGQLANETLSQSMSIIDSEYQFDRKKLIFYYKANHRIDFRDLVRDLFRIYKTRIWMCAVNSNQLVYPSTNSMTQQMLQLTQEMSSPIFAPEELNTSQQQQQQPSYSYNTNENMNFNQNIWSTPPQTSSSGVYFSNTSMTEDLSPPKDPQVAEFGLGQLGYETQKIGGIWNN